MPVFVEISALVSSVNLAFVTGHGYAAHVNPLLERELNT